MSEQFLQMNQVPRPACYSGPPYREGGRIMQRYCLSVSQSCLSSSPELNLVQTTILEEILSLVRVVTSPYLDRKVKVRVIQAHCIFESASIYCGQELVKKPAAILTMTTGFITGLFPTLLHSKLMIGFSTCAKARGYCYAQD